MTTKEQSREYSRRWAEKHPDQVRAKNKRWRAANPEKVKHYRRKYNRKKLGLSVGGEQRTGECPICDVVGVLVPDHDHLTGASRDWLCAKCNWILGTIEKAARDGRLKRFLCYLERYTTCQVA